MMTLQKELSARSDDSIRAVTQRASMLAQFDPTSRTERENVVLLNRAKIV